MASDRSALGALLAVVLVVLVGALWRPEPFVLRLALVALLFASVFRLFLAMGLIDSMRAASAGAARARPRAPQPVSPGSHDPADIGDPSNWSGQLYELTLELRPADDARLDAALKAVWHHAGVEGCYQMGRHGSKSVVPVRIGLASLGDGHLHGVARLPTGARVVCGILAIRWDADSDWLTFYLPYGALSASDPAVDAFYSGDGPESLVWRLPLDDWLADIASRVHAEVAIAQGLVGLEDGNDFDDFAEGIPDEHWDGYLVPAEDGLAYHRATR